ncbi:MAG: biotin/lipoyl-binding protein, partial [Pseudomonadota bacterium]
MSEAVFSKAQIGKKDVRSVERTKTEMGDDASVFDAPVAQIGTQGSQLFLIWTTVFTVLVLTWASLAEVERVTRGAGRVVSQERNNIVQHLEGGILTEIFVAEGDRVERGDTLFRIENSFAQAELSAATLDLAVLQLKRDRLSAEANGLAAVVFEQELAEQFPEQVAQQLRFYEKRRQELAETL